MKLRRKNPNLSKRERRAAKLLGRGQKLVNVAKKCGVISETVCEWEQKPKFQQLMEEEKKKQESILDAAANDIDRKTVESAKITGREGAPDRRLYYQLLGKLVDRQKVEMDPLVIVRAEKETKEKAKKELERVEQEQESRESDK